MAEFVEVMRQKKRLCKGRDCDDCPLSMRQRGGDMVCSEYMTLCPEEAEKIIMTWAKNNPEKTMKDVLLEKFPNAQKNPEGAPVICVTHVGFKKPESCIIPCSKCWKRPAPEEYQHE